MPLLTLPRQVPEPQRALYRAGEPRGSESGQWSSSHSISRSHQQSFGGHASSIPCSVAMTPGALVLPGRKPSSPTLSLMPTAKHTQAGLPRTVSRSPGVTQS